MLRRILAVLAGLITDFVCITAIENIGHYFYPPPVYLLPSGSGF